MQEKLVRFGTCLQYKLLSSLGSMENGGVKVMLLSLDDIAIVVYFDEEASNAITIKTWVDGFFFRNQFKIGGIVPDAVSVSYSVSCSELVMESFLQGWKPWMLRLTGA